MEQLQKGGWNYIYAADIIIDPKAKQDGADVVETPSQQSGP